MTQDDGLPLIYDLVKEQLALQQAQKASLESKANTLIAFAGGMLGLLMGAWNTIINFPIICQQIIIASVGLFVVSIITANIVTWVRKYRSDPSPAAITAAEFLNTPAEDIRLQVMSNWVGAWKHNNKTIETTASILRLTYVLQALAFGVLALAFSLSLK